MNPSLLLRGGPSGPGYWPSTPGYVLTIQADGRSVAPAPGGGGGGGVTTWNGRTGIVLPLAGDYDASEVANDSSVPGASVKDALDTLYSAPPGGVTSWNSRAGIVVPVAGDYAASLITNDSSVVGAFVDDALNTLATSIGALSIATTAPLAGGGLLSSGLTLTVADVSNASKGVAPAITLANGALVANGAGTSASWALVTNANISASAVIAVTKLEVGPANTFLKGTGAGNAWAALATAPASPGDNGKIYIANAGDASFYAGTVQGQALIWDTTSGWIAGTNFGANNLVTTGYVSIGASPATSGDLRVKHSFQVTGLLTTLTNKVLWDWGVAAPDTLSIGSNTTAVNILSNPINLIAGGVITQITSTAVTVIQGAIQFGNAVAGIVRTANTVTHAALGQRLTVRGQIMTGGGGTTGGGIDIAAGTGDTNGYNRLLKSDAATQLFKWDDTGLCFYGGATVAQAARPGQLTDSTTGAASATLVDVGAVPTQAAINNNFASLAAKYNALELACHNIGLVA